MLYTTHHVANISTKKEKKSQGPRIFSQIQNKNRPECAGEKASKRQEKIIRLSMLSKKNRVDKKAVERIFKEGKTLNFSCFSFRFILTNTPISPRISFVAPKDVAKLAVKRNSLRRRGYAVLKKHIKYFPAGLLGVFVFKRYQDDALIIENEIKNIVNKIN
ncbi:hypothetical protein A2443_03070 [Candidatus Nomurabacteria bacterium RIFOXYC2_FULL_43_16]|uniref:Uncharacterized protein n=2 Tax=Candidatus Nomuraibacteriota TaxID=1752729 RepID=A0A1F6YPT3_9BACT|nr:MAG: hypothetical protein UV13_C0006G0047 [Parcubacteria group bacterium GW2011_GWC1_42_21]KKS58408.1 MAG: hypothetical protein UV23_C0008G0023 [Candidatus Nomurabacteria bacterium GW2011_GWF1_42_40]KKT00310.1 MAG: hypothetical protein UV77_C0005G0047 [Candidatus Nomurabacteria bacterium GW2011_GWA1_43_17]KKT08114.1 MAG: hypothetical protein UV85_C0001G0047 [Candidatus Nomurabacteria bacterium GW2011_GWB1_43_19]KKT11499.1 MAG: hypothetical protein UV91_C0005G0047 [Candidatus Nomurabacteria b